MHIQISHCQWQFVTQQWWLEEHCYLAEGEWRACSCTQMEPRASAVSQQTEFRMPVSRNSRMFQFSKWYENHEPVDQFSRKLVFECKLWILMLSYQLASPRPSIGFGGTRLTSPVFLPLSWRYWCKSITDHYHISQTLPTLNLAAALHLQPPSKSRRQKLTMCGLLASGGWSIWSLKIKIADKIYFFSTAVGDAALVYPSGFLLGMAG